jgi:hypothetical protein
MQTYSLGGLNDQQTYRISGVLGKWEPLRLCAFAGKFRNKAGSRKGAKAQRSGSMSA